jgi:outer membrane protein assembly factor BamE (lipoprotein component of BamABCDE complex)
MKTIVLAILVLGVVGCAMKMGTREITDEAKFAQIKVGETTKAQLVALFGKPDAVTQTTSSERGDEEIWQYLYIRSVVKPETFIPFAGIFVGGADTTTAVLLLYFKPGDDVVRQLSHQNTKTSQGGL